MTTITLNGKSFEVAPLTYGVVKKHAETLGKVVETGLSTMDRTEAAVALLRLALPALTDEDIDSGSPGALMAGAMYFYLATFARPEDAAPA